MSSFWVTISLPYPSHSSKYSPICTSLSGVDSIIFKTLLISSLVAKKPALSLNLESKSIIKNVEKSLSWLFIHLLLLSLLYYKIQLNQYLKNLKDLIF